MCVIVYPRLVLNFNLLAVQQITNLDLSFSFGQPGVDCHVRHEADFAVIQLLFLVNEVSRSFLLSAFSSPMHLQLSLLASMVAVDINNVTLTYTFCNIC